VGEKQSAGKTDIILIFRKEIEIGFHAMFNGTAFFRRRVRVSRLVSKSSKRDQLADLLCAVNKTVSANLLFAGVEEDRSIGSYKLNRLIEIISLR